jgi:hypothetical protein
MRDCVAGACGIRITGMVSDARVMVAYIKEVIPTRSSETLYVKYVNPPLGDLVDLHRLPMIVMRPNPLKWSAEVRLT